MSRFDEIAEMFTVDIEGRLMKIPRPERSVWIAVMCLFGLWGFAGVSGGDINLRCYLYPGECKVPLKMADIQKKFHIMYTVAGGRGKKGCSCHMDNKYVNPDKTEYIYHSPSLSWSCDDDISGSDLPLKEWETEKQYFNRIDTVMHFVDDYGLIYVRSHCTDADKKKVDRK